MRKLTPFYYCMLESFPFIEGVFEEIDNYKLLCRIIEYVNKTAIKTNELGTKVEELNNWFNSLDVQDEINKKLDEMAESGELQEIITKYLQISGLLCFNTLNDLKNATNVINGSFTKTYGLNLYNDGLGNFYKIREIKNTDIVDNDKIVVLNNYNNLIAEKIENSYLNNINTEIDNIKNKTDYFNLTLQPNIIYDFTNGHSQGSCVINNILYVYIENNFPYGDILKFDIVNGLYIGKISNKLLYHGNDMCAIGNKIYIASTKKSDSSLTNKSIVVFDTVNETLTELNPFENINKNHIFGIAKFNENTLLCALTSSQNILDIGLYLYNLDTNSISQITITNTNNIVTLIYAFQSMEVLDNKIYIMTSLPDTIIELEINNNIANVNKIYNLPLTDNNNFIVGEYEGISKCEVFGKTALIITSIITDNMYNNTKTIKSYIIDPINNVCNTNLIYPNIPYTTSNDQRILLYLKSTSNSLFENGSSNYPYKSLSRALRAIEKSTNINNIDIIIDDNASYYESLIINKKVGIVANTNRTPSIYLKRILNCKIGLTGIAEDTKMNIYLTQNTDGAPADIVNSDIEFTNCIINLINRTWLNNSNMKIFHSSINKMSGFTSSEHLWLTANQCLVIDSGSYPSNIANKYYRLAGDSILFLGNQSLVDVVSTKIDHTSTSTVIKPGVYTP